MRPVRLLALPVIAVLLVATTPARGTDPAGPTDGGIPLRPPTSHPGRPVAEALGSIRPPSTPVELAQAIGGSTRPRDQKPRTPDARLPKPAGHRSPVKAALLSLAIPGAGQFYNGSNTGYLFMGVEATGWVAWASLRSTGHDIEDRFKAYADRHWTFERYRDPNSGGCPTGGHSDGGLQDSTLVYLHDNRPDDYYEDIGKLDIYACGWDAATNRSHYQDMRDESNSFLRNSRYAMTMVFLNHLVSAVHAARGAAHTNARLAAGMDLGVHLSPSIVNPSARLTLSRHF